jgi:phosphatidylglycerophosphate synthase
MPTCVQHHHLDTIPNLVTMVRPVCTLPYVLCCARGHWSALCLYMAIISSDILDGWLARRLGQTSPLGRTLDHACDVLFILTALGFFASRGLAPWWLPGSIAWAFGLYVVDSWWRSGRQPQCILLTSRLGHLGGILYYVIVGVITGNLCADNTLVPPTLLYSGFQALALLALLSGIERLVLLAGGLRRRVLAGRIVRNIRQSIRSEP